MYDLRLSEDQVAIRDMVRDFVSERLFPNATRPARLEPFDVPIAMDLLDEAAALGLRTLALPEADGGAGADTLTRCLVAEELAAGDVDIAAVLARSAALGDALFNRLMNQEQRQRFLALFLDDQRYHLALADQEAGTDGALGPDYHRPTGGKPQVATTARRQAGDYVIDGSKLRIANAPLARLFVVLAQADDGPALFLVPADSAGIRVSEVPRDGGWYVGACGDVALAGVRVPAANRLGPDALRELADPATPFGLAEAQAVNLGVGRAAFSAALDYARLRVQGGRPIIEHQAIGAKLAGIAVDLETVRSAVWQAAFAADNPDLDPPGNFPPLPRATISQVVAAERVYRAARDAAECFGAMGVMRDMPLQKYIHVSRMFLHSGAGTSDARLRIAEALAGFARD